MDFNINNFRDLYFVSKSHNLPKIDGGFWVREAFKKKNPKKVWNFPNRGGGSWPIPNFFFEFFGFFLKALGKHWKWSDSSRNAKKKNSFLCGGGTL